MNTSEVRGLYPPAPCHVPILLRGSLIPFALVCTAFVCCLSATAQGVNILIQGATLERVFDGGRFTEGPAAGPDGAMYFSDLTFASGTPGEDGHIWRYSPKNGVCTIFRSPSGMSNGIEFDATGRMLVAQGSDYGGRGVVRTDLATGKSEILISMYNGKPLNSPNDLVVDSKGRIYFTDPRYGSRTTVQQPVMGVYRLDPDGNTTLVIPDLPMPNGIALSPDEKTLYVGCFDEGSDGGTRPPTSIIRAYRLSSEGVISGGRTIVTYMPGTGPDGMTIDSSGDLFVAVRDEQNPRIGVYDSTGSEIFRIPLPEMPSNVAFARPPEDTQLYITAGGGLYRIQTCRHGSFPTQW